jgi:hypothetical protein
MLPVYTCINCSTTLTIGGRSKVQTVSFLVGVIGGGLGCAIAINMQNEAIKTESHIGGGCMVPILFFT